jgi:hypothetical protein
MVKMTKLIEKKFFPFFVFGIFSIILLGKLLSPGYIFTLDMIFPPYKDFMETIYGVEQFFPIYISTQNPLYFLIGISGQIFPLWFVQKIFLFLIFVLSGISAYRLCPSEMKSAKYFAGFFYMINPFVYVRFLAGHWKILLAYAIVPFAIKAFMDLLEKQDKKRLIEALLWITLVGVFNVHILILTLGVCGILFVLKIIQIRRDVKERNGLLKLISLLCISYIVLNSYWLLPTFTAGTTIVEQMGTEDLNIYATKSSAINTVFTTASMYGFWREGYLYTKDILPLWYIFFAFILYLTVQGFIFYYRDEKVGIYVKGFGAAAIIGFVLGSGIHGPFSRVFEFLYNNVSFFRGFRDSHKFVALIVLAYAFLGSLGIAVFTWYIKDRDIRKKIISISIIILALITPFVYSFTIFNGFWGQLKPFDYPKDWYEMNDYLNNDPQEFKVLFFPWHAYMDFKWLPNAQKRSLDPSASFFDKPVINGENAEIGSVYTYSANPVQLYIQFLLDKKDQIDDFGELVSPLNIKYILLTKEADYKKYFFLFNQSDLELVRETENFYLFKNKYETAKIYEVDGITYISNWEELLERSRIEDITQRVYLTGDNSEDVQGNSDKKILGYEKRSPVKYDLTEKTSKKYLIFTEPYSDSWEHNGKKPVKAYGVVNAYELDGPDGKEIRYERFYKVYLPSYIISLLSFLAVLVFYLDLHRKFHQEK